MVDLDAALFHHFLELPIADRIGHIPADAPQDHVTFKMAALELDHRAVPLDPFPAIIPQATATKVCDRTVARHPGAAVIIPPRSTAVASETAATQRDQHLATIAKRGRMTWQRSSGYSRRSLVETAMYRYKTIIGRRLHARTLPTQRTEARTACNVLNRMTSLGMPISIRSK